MSWNHLQTDYRRINSTHFKSESKNIIIGSHLRYKPLYTNCDRKQSQYNRRTSSTSFWWDHAQVLTTLRLHIIWMVSNNAIKIGIRWLILSFYEPSKLYLVTVSFDFDTSGYVNDRYFPNWPLVYQQNDRCRTKMTDFHQIQHNDQSVLYSKL